MTTFDYEKAFLKIKEQVKRETEWAKDYEQRQLKAFEEAVDREEPKDKFEKRAYQEDLKRKEAKYWFAHGMLDTYEEIVRLIDNLKKDPNFQKE